MAAIAEVEKYAWLHSEKKTKDDDKCWADAKCLGKDFPAIDSLEFIKKELPAMGEKPTLFVFWAKMAKGMFSSFHQLTEVSKMFPGVNIVGVGIDAVKDAALKMLKKEGEAMSTFNIDALSFDYPLAYDTDMKVKKAFMAIAGTKILTPGTLVLVTKDNKVAWMEVLKPSYLIKDSMICEQMDKICKGEELFSWGNEPEDESSDEEEDDGAAGGPAPEGIPGLDDGADDY